MSYELLCASLYEERLEKKKKLDQSRNRFRQSVLDRQNRIAASPSASKEDEVVSDQEDEIAFVMPEILPSEERKLKWLIFQNLDMKKRFPDKAKEADGNIKRIKDFITENKVVK